MRRSPLLALLALAVLVAGCGSTTRKSQDARQALVQGTVMGPYLYNYAGIERDLADNGLVVRRTGADSQLDRVTLPRPQQVRRYTTKGGTPFVLLLFQSEDIANDALNSVETHAGNATVVVGKNFLAVVQSRGGDFDRLTQLIQTLGSNPPGPEPAVGS